MKNNHSIATMKYNREKTVLLTVRLNKKTDAKLIEQINRKSIDKPKSAYIKELIAQDVFDDTVRTPIGIELNEVRKNQAKIIWKK